MPMGKDFHIKSLPFSACRLLPILNSMPILKNEVAFITGAASGTLKILLGVRKISDVNLYLLIGIGKAIAENITAQGQVFFYSTIYASTDADHTFRGQVVIADINLDAGTKFAEELNTKYTAKYVLSPIVK
jgi:hypothetical protein